MATPQEEQLNGMLGMTAAELDARARAYESDEFELGPDDTVHEGSPVEYLEGIEETFVVAADDLDARARGCEDGEIGVVADDIAMDGPADNLP